MINCLAIDDETPALDILEDNIRRVPFLHLVNKCKNAYAALEAMAKDPVDLLFLDIEMPGISGLSFLKSLPNKPMVIFITAYRNYAVEGFELDVLDYLVKPVAFDRFLKAVNKALEYHGFKEKEGGPSFPDYLFIHTEYQLTKIVLQEITYIEGLRNYIRIHFSTDAKPILSKLSLKAIEEKLPPAKFTRVHKSFIVCVDKIASIRNDVIRIGARDIPISKSCRDEFFRKINGA
ncbi:MAG TPA: LytTR family DNA-binding domain-containing protein [Puia sp.]|jgi:DNA-binding LytR/AlgR family response regulator|nr:LytTR family DNA-binding domain-containing protein [Puia sp.]